MSIGSLGKKWYLLSTVKDRVSCKDVGDNYPSCDVIDVIKVLFCLIQVITSCPFDRSVYVNSTEVG